MKIYAIGCVLRKKDRERLPVRINSDIIDLATTALELEAQNDDLRKTLVNVIRIVEISRQFARTSSDGTTT